MGRKEWKNVWPATHACTAFFTIDANEVRHLLPKELTLKTDKAGRAEIELGFVRFREGFQGDDWIGATEEMAWAIAVERRSGFGFAFYAMNLAADNETFLAHNEAIGFHVYRPSGSPVRFHTDLDRRSFEVEDDHGRICVLRHQPEGSLTLPFFPVTTEVWTGSSGNLQRRHFKWRGVAQAHFAASVASTICGGHPFFREANVSRAAPVPVNVFSSQRVAAHASQVFTDPVSVTTFP